MKNTQSYDVIVIGAGHAGLEAAFAAAKKGAKTAIVTLSEDNIGKMPCNPSIGGPAKGIVTKEIGALGGMQAVAADDCQIQMKMLGTSKGPGVWALRGQIDKVKYQEWFIDAIKKQKNLDLIIGEVNELLVSNNKITGVIIDQNEIACQAIVLTSGTYLKSKTFCGATTKNEGADSGKYSKNLSSNLKELGFKLIRLKTGTPPRIAKTTIKYDLLEADYGSQEPLYFNEYGKQPKWYVEKIQPCYLLHTSKLTHELIKENINQSPLYSGMITGIGPRYCPSIEDKIMKFPHHERHQIFIEPESLSLDTMYLGGFSTSMPTDLQEKMVHSLLSLEDCKIVKYGYAIEYDAIDPTQLLPTLMSKKIAGFFSAGQINGTSGYEEAAGQGIVAGINAANYASKKNMIVLDRSNSYIGVMIDDIVTKGVTEPYRLLTSRAEHRLYLRNDNAKERMIQIGFEQGLVSENEYKIFKLEQEISNKTIDFLKSKTVGQIPELNQKVLKNNITLFEYLKRPEIKIDDILKYTQKFLDFKISDLLKSKIEINVKFSGYIKTQEEKINQIRNMKNYDLSRIKNYKDIPNLPLEAIDKLNKILPMSLQQASRISGINLEDILKIKYYLDNKCE